MGYELFGEKITFPSTPVPGINNDQSFTMKIWESTILNPLILGEGATCHVLVSLKTYFRHEL